MNFKTTVCALCLLSACVISTTKNPVTNSFLRNTSSLISDSDIIEETAIAVSLSLANFDEISAKTQAFICPVLCPIVTCDFGYRTHPLTSEYGFHSGIDLACIESQEVFAVLDGEIIDCGYDEIYGNYITISHDNGYESFYAHLSEIIASGEVLQGEIIGIIGDTGVCTGAHLHFEIRQDGEVLDPSLVIDFYEN